MASPAHRHPTVVLGSPVRPRAEPAAGDVRRDRPVRCGTAMSAMRKLLAGAARCRRRRRPRRFRPGRRRGRQWDRDQSLPTRRGTRRWRPWSSTPGGLAGEARTPDAFEVLEAGIAGRRCGRAVPTDDLEVMLVLDTSGSMAGAPIESEKAAASEFVSLLPAEVGVGVVAYGSTPVLIAAPSTDRQAVTASIAPCRPATDTALYDAVIFAAGQFTPGGRTAQHRAADRRRGQRQRRLGRCRDRGGCRRTDQCDRAGHRTHRPPDARPAGRAPAAAWCRRQRTQQR